ncbi:oxidoreductase, partial [Pseudoalteromonas sp. S1612]
EQGMRLLGKLLLATVAYGENSPPHEKAVEFNAKAVSSALNHQLAGGLTGKQVVKII